MHKNVLCTAVQNPKELITTQCHQYKAANLSYVTQWNIIHQRKYMNHSSIHLYCSMSKSMWTGKNKVKEELWKTERDKTKQYIVLQTCLWIKFRIVLSSGQEWTERKHDEAEPNKGHPNTGDVQYFLWGVGHACYFNYFLITRCMYII